MTTQLPAHLQNRAQSLITHAADGMGGLLPPHISIKDNRFTFVDGAGYRRTHEQITLDVIVCDLSEHMNKRFYEYDYEPGADDPPTCWSANGVGPSIDAIEPQASTCAARRRVPVKPTCCSRATWSTKCMRCCCRVAVLSGWTRPAASCAGSKNTKSASMSESAACPSSRRPCCLT